MKRTSLVWVCLALLSGATASAQDAPRAEVTTDVSQARTYFHNLCFQKAVRPRPVIVYCADAGVRLKSLRWPRWGGELARGRGTAWVNDCIPFCAAGTFHRRPVRVWLDRREYCPDGDAYAYRRMRYRLGGRLPTGVRREAKLTFTCALNGL